MKLLSKSGTAALILCLSAVLPAHADEGMWTLYNLPQPVFEQMQAEGFLLPYSALYSDKGALKDCVVNFSGYCSGVVVSPDGLVFTNHHCGFEAIRSHSTVEHDYMLNGFVAKSYDEELPNENMFVSFMKKQEDITPRLKADGFESMDVAQKDKYLDSLENHLTDSVRHIDSTLHVNIDPFYEGNRYYATTYQDFTDLRLVFAVPKSMGKFGGETDNWMWPRQTCDFSVFRIYAGKDNRPAAYSKDNVPYHPERWAQVSMEGYKDGDYAMTIGYPGSTSRYLSSYGIRERRDAENEPRIQVRGIKQEIMARHMKASEAVRIKYDSKYAQSANYWKNSIGMNKCIDSIGLIAQKQAYEARLRQWQKSTGYLKGKLDFDKMAELYQHRFNLMKDYTYFVETFYRSSEFSTRAFRLNRMEIHGKKEEPKKEYIQFEDNSKEWDAALDKEVFAALLENYRRKVGSKFLPDFYKSIDTQFGGDCARYVDYLYKKSFLLSSKPIYVNRPYYQKDPGVIYGLDLLGVLSDLRTELSACSDSINDQERYLCDAKIRMEQDQPHYSDANFTMRLSYGQVGGFLLGGEPSGYYTDAASIVAKMERGSQIADYQAEPVMRQLLSATDFGRYQDKTTGKLQLCFLTNNDITGGNSGSPMFDGKGRLIGLAFDGNWDSLSSDINFDRKLARCIGVDIRYVLFLMDKWGHADRLLKELGVN